MLHKSKLIIGLLSLIVLTLTAIGLAENLLLMVMDSASQATAIAMVLRILAIGILMGLILVILRQPPENSAQPDSIEKVAEALANLYSAKDLADGNFVTLHLVLERTDNEPGLLPLPGSKPYPVVYLYGPLHKTVKSYVFKPERLKDSVG